VIKDRVADFLNDFPYLPGDQRVMFMWNEDKVIGEKCLHRFKLEEFRKLELYWLLKGCIIRGKQYKKPKGSKVNGSTQTALLRRAPDLMRMVVGFNLGRLAGQSIPHFHAQYGWEVVLNQRTLSQNQLSLYYEELEIADLVIFQNKNIKVVAPWTPLGQFALDLHFTGKFDVCEMTEEDMKLFAVFGHAIIRKYLRLGIQNMNIVFTNSPNDRQIEPLTVHFVPRVSMTALYEIKGVNVVDTPPSKIAEEFRRFTGTGREEINWSEIYKEGKAYNPDADYINEVGLMNRPLRTEKG
jgi:diadenosine tetraphosphate (Ap4A) HIT family hydrolase